MIVYRDVVRRVDPDDLLARLEDLGRRGRSVDSLVELGKLEQAISDARHPDRDDWTEADRVLRDSVITAAAAPDRGTDRTHRLRRALSGVRAAVAEGPAVVEVRSPEGYAHYGLDPNAYRATAEAYRRDVGERAARSVVIGIRSIGTSLSAIVAATVGSRNSVTVRPRGESGARSVCSTARLDEVVRAGLGSGGDVLLVDEGPGVTGETFECVARWARGVGVPSDRIVLFPSHDGAMPLAPDERRRWFRKSRRYLPPVRDDRARAIADHRGWTDLEDLSAGAWRSVVETDGELPACPHFERLKYRALEPCGKRRLLRYGGLGSCRDRLVARSRTLARALADAPGAPGLEPLRSETFGFVSRRWIDGRTASQGDLRDAGFRRAVARYVFARAGLFRTGDPVDRTRWRRVLVENATEADGVEPGALSAAVSRLESLPEREAFLPDGRLQIHEWILGEDGYGKVDALEHGDGFRLPGPADAAWDVAGAILELRLSEAEVRELIGRCAEGLEGPRSALADAVVAYRPVYAAAAFGDAALSARELGDGEDARRLEAVADRYGRMLRNELRRGSPRGGRIGPGAARRRRAAHEADSAHEPAHEAAHEPESPGAAGR